MTITTNRGFGQLREKHTLGGRERGWGQRRTWLVLELGVEAPNVEYSKPYEEARKSAIETIHKKTKTLTSEVLRTFSIKSLTPCTESRGHGGK